jgi:hypothetical protein
MSALVLLAAFNAGAVEAQVGPAFCDGVKQVVEQIPADFASLRGAPVAEADGAAFGDVTYISTLTLDGASRCTVSLGPSMGGFTPSTFMCTWEGLAPSVERAGAIYDAMQTCLGGDASGDLAVLPISANPEAADASIVRPGLLSMLLASPEMTALAVSSQANPMAMVRLHMRRP